MDDYVKMDYDCYSWLIAYLNSLSEYLCNKGDVETCDLCERAAGVLALRAADLTSLPPDVM